MFSISKKTWSQLREQQREMQGIINRYRALGLDTSVEEYQMKKLKKTMRSMSYEEMME